MGVGCKGKILKPKNTIPKMKNLLEVCDSSLETAEEEISK